MQYKKMETIKSVLMVLWVILVLFLGLCIIGRNVEGNQLCKPGEVERIHYKWVSCSKDGIVWKVNR